MCCPPCESYVKYMLISNNKIEKSNTREVKCSKKGQPTNIIHEINKVCRILMKEILNGKNAHTSEYTVYRQPQVNEWTSSVSVA